MASLRSDEDNVEYVKNFIDYLKENNKQQTIDEMVKFKNPDDAKQKHWVEFLQDRWDVKLKAFRDAGNYPFKKLEIVKLKDLTVKWLNKPIELEECNIASIAPNRPIQERHTYICTYCYRDGGSEGIHYTKRMPKACKDCGSADNLQEEFREDDLVDAQWIRVQEINRDSNTTKIPVTIPVRMTGRNMIWKVGFNECVKLQGLLQFIPVKTKIGGTELTPWFEVFAYEKTSGMDEQIELTLQDEEWIKAEMKKKGYWNKIIQSFCPWIYGQEVMKEVVLLGIGSMKTDMPLRILIIGDPSTGKSDVLKASNMLPAQKHYTVMKNNRGTGLTVTSVKDQDTDQWTVEGGGFARAHGWTLIIDEFQAGREEDIDGLNSVIWDHKIPYNLAGGVHGEFQASCALIIACNPQGGTMAKDQNIHELLKFVGEKTLPAFISRMSFILYLKEDDTKEFQAQVASHIFDNWSDEMKKQRFWEDKKVELQTTTMKILDIPPIVTEDVFGIKSLQKIVQYITTKVPLTSIPSNLKDKFVKYYVDKRMDTADVVNKIITPRYMVHLLGIAQNKGRWHGRGAPNKDDMEYAFELMYHHMTLAAIDPKTGEMDAGSLNGNIPERRMKEIELEQLSEKGKDYQWSWAWEKAEALHEDGYFSRDELLQFLEMIPRAGWQYKSVEISKRINRGIDDGTILSKGDRFKTNPRGPRL